MTSVAIAQTEIEVTGVQKFLGKEIPVIEGGFGEGEKVVLAKTIAEIHEVELKDINRLINDNIDEFEELEKNRTEFCHELGKILGSCKIEVEKINEEFRFLKIEKVEN